MASRLSLTLSLAILLGFPGLSPGIEMEHSLTVDSSKWVISSGRVATLPAGSMLALALALERGAEAVWLDLVLSKDDKLILLPDTRIDQLTDIQEIYPDRARPDGSYHSFDFTLVELRPVSLKPEASSESISLPLSKSHLPITALEDFFGYLDLVVDDLATRPALICTLKQGWRHQLEEKDLGAAVLKRLENYQLTNGAAKLIIASYDPEELQELATTAGSEPMGRIGFLQLIGANDGTEVQRLEFGVYQPYSFDLLFTRFGLKSLSSYADTIGLDLGAAVAQSGTLSQPRFLADAHTLGLRVVCLRVDSTAHHYLADDSSAPESMFEHLLFTIGFDGIVTDADRLARSWLKNRAPARDSEQSSIIERLIDRVEDTGSEPPAPAHSDETR
jgi:glycerophosphoryl diester phosphodiesterase